MKQQNTNVTTVGKYLSLIGVLKNTSSSIQANQLRDVII
jgi:hypothetical protein